MENVYFGNQNLMNKENRNPSSEKFFLPTFGLNKRAQSKLGRNQNQRAFKPPAHMSQSSRRSYNPDNYAPMYEPDGCFVPNNPPSYVDYKQPASDFDSPNFYPNRPGPSRGPHYDSRDFDFGYEEPPAKYPRASVTVNRPVTPPAVTARIVVKKTDSAKWKRRETLRVLSGNVDKVLLWSKLASNHEVLFEVIGVMDQIRIGQYPTEKVFTLKDSATGPALQVVFYEIDRELSQLEPGSVVKVVGAMKSRSRLQAFQVMQSSVMEQTSSQHVTFLCDRTANELLKGN